MGRTRQRHNWKARQKVDVVIDKKEEKKVQQFVDSSLISKDEEALDECNALVLPSKKRETIVSNPSQAAQGKMTKKDRKKLEKILEFKRKKERHAELLEKLQAVQASQKELDMMVSTAEVHSQRFKRSRDASASKVESNSQAKRRCTSGATNSWGRPSSDAAVADSDTDTSDISTDESDTEESAKVTAASTVSSVAQNDEQSAKTEATASLEPMEVDTKSKVVEKSQATLPVASVVSSKPAVHIHVERTSQIQELRLKLPILAEEQAVMEAISEHMIVLLCGETGSGKTTQVPQFLYEAGYAHSGQIIGMTEPRRVAAISMSQRIAEEMNLSSREVSYQIRFEGNSTDDTKIKLMTDGVLLKEIQKDFLLKSYSVIIIDEAHERSVYTDILIGLLSRIAPLRAKRGNPLKLVIMSATLRVEDFTQNTRLFKVPPPVVKVESRQFPVTIHFNKRTPDDYMGEAYKKVCKIHQQLPEGAILVFVTGQQEVHVLISKLRRTFADQQPGATTAVKKTSRRQRKSNLESATEPSSAAIEKAKAFSLDNYSALPQEDGEGADDIHAPPSTAAMSGEPRETAYDSSDDDFGGVEEDVDDDEDEKGVNQTPSQPLYVLPLYSMLPSHRQAAVFKPPPEGSRLCIVATNVAETSLTIPNVRYVVDTGRVKTKVYDKVTGVSTFVVSWVSQASANQRAGRAGRTGPGHCYRLYSSAVFGDFEKFSPPEIVRRPVEDLFLQMKDIGIEKIINFPFPTPPSEESLKAAESLLVSLGALKKVAVNTQTRAKKKEFATTITPLGRAMACFPVSARYSKMISVAEQHDLLPYVIAIVAALSVPELLIKVERLPDGEQVDEEQKLKRERWMQVKKRWAGTGASLQLGDLGVLLKAVGAAEFAGCTPAFCELNGIRHKAMVEVRRLRAQLTNAVNSLLPNAGVSLDPQMAPPSDVQCRLLRQVVLSAMGDRVARKMEQPIDADAATKKSLMHAYQSCQLDEPVFIHPSSVLFRQRPDYIVYQYVEETSKLYMQDVCVVEADWLTQLVPAHCHFSEPVQEPCPRYDSAKGIVLCHMNATYGAHLWSLPVAELDHPDTLDKYKWFAKFFLEGLVCAQLSKYAKCLLSTPSTMVKSWARLQPRTETLLKALISETVNSRDKLKNVWSRKKDYLLPAYLEWLPPTLHAEVTTLWPPSVSAR